MNGCWNFYQDYDSWQEACNALTWLEKNGNKVRKVRLK